MGRAFARAGKYHGSATAASSLFPGARLPPTAELSTPSRRQRTFLAVQSSRDFPERGITIVADPRFMIGPLRETSHPLEESGAAFVFAEPVR
ncbi:MAG TPA: hypothetical protein VEK33_11000 [Terriglobales bacterium]|nr:hypothetical protein [Terriglobales bacterium]